MFFTNAIMQRKENFYEAEPCFIEKVIELETTEYRHFSLNLLRDYLFIEENKDLMFKKSDGWHCLLVLPKDGTDGILIESEGYGYSRYSSFVPNARLLIESQEQIQNHQKAIATEVKFYCPLTIQSDADSNELYEMPSAEAFHYTEAIQKAIDNYNNRTLNNFKGLMEYFDESESVKQKVLCYKPTTIVEHNGELYGVIEAQIQSGLTDGVLEILIQSMVGQMSDGWGEGLEQREIPYEDGNLYVSFWNSGNDYFIKTEDEFQEYLEQQEQSGSMKMGGY